MDTNKTASDINLIPQNDSTPSQTPPLTDTSTPNSGVVNSINNEEVTTPLVDSASEVATSPVSNSVSSVGVELPVEDSVKDEVTSPGAETTNNFTNEAPKEVENSANESSFMQKPMPSAEESIINLNTDLSSSVKQENKSNLVPILLLLFLYPIGLFYMWFGTKWSFIVKVLLTLPLVIGLALLAITTITPPTT